MNPMINTVVATLNSLGDTFCRHAAGVFTQSALLVVFLFFVDLLLRRRIRAVFRYCVWLLVLVKLILPPTLSLPTGIGYWAGNHLPPGLNVSDRPFDLTGFEGSDISIERPHAGLSDNLVEAAPPVVATNAPLTVPTWKAILFILWVMGVLAFLVLLVQRARFVRGLIAVSTPATAEFVRVLEQCRRQIGIRLKTTVRISETISSPAVCGFFRPIILIPASLVGKLSPEGLRVILIHELAHIKRADLWVNSIQTFLQVVYFYNPFVWFANSMIRKVCEEAVDETVLVSLGGEAKDYSNTLIDIGEMSFWKADLGLRLIGVAESKKALQWRIRHMLTRPIPKSAKIGAFSTIAILLIAAILLPMARGERSKQKASVTGRQISRGADEPVPAMAEGDVLVDPNIGVKFVLAKTFSGANNVIGHVNKLILSPDARFLLFWGRVVPLDGTEMFCYTERSGDVREVAVSPNGRYIAHGESAVWLQPVSPKTLRPDGPAKKILDLRGGRLRGTQNIQTALYWTRDSQTVFFQVYYTEGQLHKYAFSAATGAPVSYPEAESTGLISPDGKCVALTDTYEGFWVKPVGDGAARILCDKGSAPECWSKDGHWLIGFQPWGGARFVSYPEGKEYYVPLPKELAERYSTTGVGLSNDRSRLFFYQASTKLTPGARVASAEGTALSDVIHGWPITLQWSPDGKEVFHTAWTVGWETSLFASTLSGGKAVQFTLSPAVSGGTTLLRVSPDGKWLLFTAAQESDRSTLDLNVIPLSVADHKASGPATVVFRYVPLAGESLRASVWSPDSTRVALSTRADPADEEDIWVVFTDARTPIRLTRTAAIEHDLKWSPDGDMLAFVSDDAGAGELRVIPTAGGEAAVIRKWIDAGPPTWGWSPDSKSLTIVEEGVLVRQPLSGGKVEPILNLKEYGFDEWVGWLAWSPDGSRLALEAHRKPDTKEPLASSYGQLLFARVEGGHVQQTGATDLGPATWTGNHAWSPDGTHVGYSYEGLVAMRPEGRLYGVAVDDIVERIEKGAIPATQPKVAESTTGSTR